MATLRVPGSHEGFQNIDIASGSVQTLPGVSGAQLEIVAVVNTTGGAGSCGFRVLSSSSGLAAADGSVEYTTAGLASYMDSTYMTGTDVPGGDYNVTNVAYTGA